MARSQGVSPLVFVAVGVVALAAVGAFVLMQNHPTPKQAAPATIAPPTLPAGKLQLVRDRMSEARYVSLDRVQTPQGIEAAVLTVGKASVGLEGGAAMTSQTKRFDCARGRVFDGDVGSFDAYGKPLATKTLYAGTVGRVPDGDEVEAALVCGKNVPGKPVVVAGYRGAQLESQMPPDDYGKVADADPENAQAWAWMCAAGARGRWRAQTPADCDRAAKLNPDQVETQLDRAFLNLKIGKPARAAAQFRAISAKAPDNAAAAYGLSLLQALGGDKAASRETRAHALDLDPAVVDWVAERYALQISQEYRVR